MRLFGFELKKLFMNRMLAIGLLLLTLVSSCLYFLEAKPKEDPLMPYLDAYMEYYSKDPEKARSEADAYIKAYKEAEEEAGFYIPKYPDSVHVDESVGTITICTSVFTALSIIRKRMKTGLTVL